MTGHEILIEYSVKLNKLDTKFNRLVKPEVALILINDALKKVIKDKYSPKPDVTGVRAFQSNQRNTDELNSLIKSIKLNSASGLLLENNEYIINLPSDYFVYLGSRVLTNNGRYSYPRVTTLDKLEVSMKNPFREPDTNYPLAYFSEGKFRLPKPFQGNKFEIVDGLMSYLSLPEKITINSTDVNYSFMEEVIDTAVTFTNVQWGVNKPDLGQVVNTK